MGTARSKAKRTAWWGWWGGASLLALVAAVAVFSEVWAVSWRENTFGVARRFQLAKSSIVFMWRTSEDNVMLTGLELFEPGWSVGRPMMWDYLPREWLPRVWLYDGTIGTYWDVRLPLWVPAASLAGLMWWKRRWRTGEVVEGVCGKCGYDLRGLKGAVCPECGRAIPSTSVR